MAHFSKKQNRRSIRLYRYDYSQPGFYFITLCVHNRENIFGAIQNGEMNFSDIGIQARRYYLKLPDFYDHLILDEFIIMPNHLHGIFAIQAPGRICTGLINQTRTAENKIPKMATNRNDENKDWILMKNPSMTLGKMIRHYKAGAACIIRKMGWKNFKWHRNYYERVIRNEAELERIRKYIRNNPKNWIMDRLGH